MYKMSICLRRFWVSRERVLHNFFRRVLIILIIFSIIYFMYCWLDGMIMPSAKEISSIKAVSIATDAINEVILNEFKNYSENNQLVRIDRDNEGNISSINSNIPEINRISSQIVVSVSQKLGALERKTIGIPLGTFINSKWLSGFGPYVKIRILPVGSVKTDFKSELIQAGINQTRYRLYMNIDCAVKIVAPLINEKTQICMSVPIVDTVIAGKVPHAYVAIDGNLIKQQ